MKDESLKHLRHVIGFIRRADGEVIDERCNECIAAHEYVKRLDAGEELQSHGPSSGSSAPSETGAMSEGEKALQRAATQEPTMLSTFGHPPHDKRWPHSELLASLKDVSTWQGMPHEARTLMHKAHEALYRYAHWTPDHTVEEWCSHLQHECTEVAHAIRAGGRPSGQFVADLLAAVGSAPSAIAPYDEHTAMLLAAISTASIQNTRESAKERIGRDNPYWTQAYGDVCAAIDREMALREKLASTDGGTDK